MHGVARGDDHEGRRDANPGKEVEKEGGENHSNLTADGRRPVPSAAGGGGQPGQTSLNYHDASGRKSAHRGDRALVRTILSKPALSKPAAFPRPNAILLENKTTGSIMNVRADAWLDRRRTQVDRNGASESRHPGTWHHGELSDRSLSHSARYALGGHYQGI